MTWYLLPDAVVVDAAGSAVADGPEQEKYLSYSTISFAKKIDMNVRVKEGTL